MYKVLCIKSSKDCIDYMGKRVESSGINVVVGEYYTVIEEIDFQDGVYYFLNEIPAYTNEVYHSSLFALVSDLDETDLVNEKVEVHAPR